VTAAPSGAQVPATAADVRPVIVHRRFFASSAGLICSLAAGVVTAIESRAAVVVVAQDHFNYSTGILTANNGGTGWSSAWSQTYGAGTSFNVSATGLSYSGLATSGGSLAWRSGGNGIDQNSRTLPMQNRGVVYIQFLARFGSSSGGGTPNLRLLNNSSLTGGVGGNGGTYGSYWSILGSDLNPLSNGAASSSTALSALNWVVLRIDYTAVSTSLYLNPNASTFDYANPGTAAATYAGLAPIFNEVALNSRSPAAFDELGVLSYTAVPEPAATTACAASALALLAWFHRSRRGGSVPSRN
jgi:hypothetical protein